MCAQYTEETHNMISEMGFLLLRIRINFIYVSICNVKDITTLNTLSRGFLFRNNKTPINNKKQQDKIIKDLCTVYV